MRWTRSSAEEASSSDETPVMYSDAVMSTDRERPQWGSRGAAEGQQWLPRPSCYHSSRGAAAPGQQPLPQQQLRRHTAMGNSSYRAATDGSGDCSPYGTDRYSDSHSKKHHKTKNKGRAAAAGRSSSRAQQQQGAVALAYAVYTPQRAD